MSDDWTPWPDGNGPGTDTPTGPPLTGRPPDWPDPAIHTPLPRLDGAHFSGAIVDNLDDVAHLLRSSADGIVADVETLARSIEFSHWLGPRADNVRGLVERQVLPALAEMADHFNGAADVLDRNAAAQRQASARPGPPPPGLSGPQPVPVHSIWGAMR